MHSRTGSSHVNMLTLTFTLAPDLQCGIITMETIVCLLALCVDKLNGCCNRTAGSDIIILYTDLPSPKGRLPYLSELLAGRRKKRPSTQHENPGPASTPDVDSPHYELGRSEPTEVVEIKVGNLWKSSQSRKEGSQPGPVRVRRFRLTEEALEYFQQFSQVGASLKPRLPFKHPTHQLLPSLVPRPSLGYKTSWELVCEVVCLTTDRGQYILQPGHDSLSFSSYSSEVFVTFWYCLLAVCRFFIG